MKKTQCKITAICNQKGGVTKTTTTANLGIGLATLEERKMIVCNLIREVKVSRGYELDVVMDMNYEQFLSSKK